MSLIRYINTDLDLVSSDPHEELFADFEDMGCLVHCENDDGGWRSTWETTRFETPEQTFFETPEETIQAILSILDSLPESARSVWQACHERTFDIGYDCGDEPWGFQQEISNMTLARIAALGATLRVTIYPERTPLFVPSKAD